jgi:Integrase zinc binding domain
LEIICGRIWSKFLLREGETNTGTDAVSCLNIVESDQNVTKVMEKVYELDNEVICRIAHNLIKEAQMKEFNELQHSKTFGSFDLYVTPTNQIQVPPSLHAKILDWFHLILMHPSVQHIKETLKMNFDWPGMTANTF